MLIRLRAPSRRQRPAFVLVAVLVVVVLLSLAAYQYSELMLAEYQAMDSYSKSTQARALADSGVAYVAALMSSSDNQESTLSNNPWDNPTAFQGILVREDPLGGRKGYFSIVSLPGPDDQAGGTQALRHGVVDESGKINLNALLLLDTTAPNNTAQQILLGLPHMTEDIANAILDWLDTDESPRSNGAESEYYSALSPSYQAKNGPLDSLEELLLVRGVTPDLMFGNDRNRNGVLDADEDDGSGILDQGWSAYLTVYSRSLNVDNTGNPRIYLNGDVATLEAKLEAAVGAELANFIVNYRKYGPSSGSSGKPSSPGGADGGRTSRPMSTPERGGPGGGKPPGGQGSGGGKGPGGSKGGETDSPGGTKGGSPGGEAGGTKDGSTGDPKGGSTGGPRGGGRPPSAGSPSPMMGQGQGRSPQGPTNGGGSQAPQLKLTSIGSVFELINASVSIPTGSGPSQKKVIIPSPLKDTSKQKQLLPLLLDKTTTTNQADLPARINVNTAPRAVLQSLPGLQDSDIQAILDHRPSLTAATRTATDTAFQTPAWLITEANIKPETLKTVDRYITASTQVYRFQSVGYFEGGGPSSRVEAVVDTNLGRPRIVYWRDLAELGKGIDPNHQAP